MKWLVIRLTPELEAGLRKLMEQRKLKRKSEAIRLAVHEAVPRHEATPDYDYRSWLGPGLRTPLRRTPRFGDEDELWA